MKLSNQQLINFVNRIKFSTTHKSEYKDQIENLIEELNDYLLFNTNLSVKKVLQAGSWRKATILKPSINVSLDIDLAFFMNLNKVRNVSDIHEMNSKIVEVLKKLYPNKSDDDFKESTKTSNVKFLTSGLSVDIVPVIDIPPNEIYNLVNYVRQPDSETNIYYVTSVKDQLNFIVKRKQENTSFTAIVRTLKHWKYYHNLAISSFSIELIVAYLDIQKGVLLNIEEAVIRFFALISAKKFPIISFNAPYGNINNYDSYIYIADPTNNSNNSAKYISNQEWKQIRLEAEKALDALSYVQVCNNSYKTLELWKEVFGNKFNITSEAI